MDEQTAADPEVHGPLDRRPIGPADLAETAHEAVRLIHSAKTVFGHRRAVIGALSALLAGVQALSDLAGDEFVAETLRHHLATAETRVAERDAGAVRPTIN